MDVATPTNELTEKLLELGWSVKNVSFKNGTYVAKGSSDQTGQQYEARGQNPALAIAALYQYAQRAYGVRRQAARKVGAWQGDWRDKQAEIARAYAKLPSFDEKAVASWKALAAESQKQADAIRSQINVNVTDDPNPYESADEMRQDIHKNRNLEVSRAGTNGHPVWSPEDSINYRVVNNVLGHGQGYGDWGWHGVNDAARHHMPLVSPLAREALMTELVGRRAYQHQYPGHDQTPKVALMSEFLHPLQQQEGEHLAIPHGGIPAATPQPAPTPAAVQPTSPVMTTFPITPVMQGFPVMTGYVRPDTQHLGMPVTRPQYVDEYLEDLVGPNEEHEVGEGHCDNPHCRAEMDEQAVSEADENGSYTCPSCGWLNRVYAPFQQGGRTLAGISLEQMGSIGEQVVFRLSSLKDLGLVVPNNQATSPQKSERGKFQPEPIDAILTGPRGEFGVEIKTNHSRAQERFKLGGKTERDAKLAYCVQRGLKPALIGVRLNFYTNRADVFFREGLTDTWIGNSQMRHVATADFSDLNPFKNREEVPPNLADSSVLSKVAAGKNPDFLFVYYMGKLRVEEYHHNRRFETMLDTILNEAGWDLSNQAMDIDPTDVAAGEIYEYEDGSYKVEHKQLAREEVREHADKAVTAWIAEKVEVFEDDAPRDPDTGQFVSEEDWVPDAA